MGWRGCRPPPPPPLPLLPPDYCLYLFLQALALNGMGTSIEQLRDFKQHSKVGAGATPCHRRILLVARFGCCLA